MKDLQLSRSQLDRSLQWLEKHHFLKRTNTHKQQMYQAELLPVPDYNPFTKVYEPIEDIRFDTRELKDRIQGYVMIPADAINNRMLIDDYHINKMWNYQNLKVLIMLYAHCWLGYFGGINPDTVHIEENLNDLSVHPSLCYNLKKTEHQVKKSIRRLLKIDYFKIVQVTFIKGKYVGDTEIVGQPDHSTTKYVLRHYYLADKKVNHKHLREKKGLIII
ncbi:hypothetical protein [Tenuibacillus multivorans]|nr:hypothetical protein [Tenuibacillus multivorans]GEL78680.1 hypothetical protein TMU01_29150 [Tenuibacillus multivorans]